MAHQPKPFFRTGRGWYVQLGKNQIKLCDGPKSPATEKLAWQEFHARMSAPTPAPNSAASATGMTVGEVFEKFLDWCQRHRSPRTYEWSKGHIQAFCDHLKTARTTPAADLKPFHVVEWVDSKPTWGPNQKRGAIVAVTRPFNWAAKLGYVAASPVRGVEKPSPEKRDSRMTPEDFRTLLSHVTDEPFRDLLTLAYEAGCRPQEARRVEARHLKLEHHRVEIPPPEAKGKRRWRVIYLSDRAEEIVTRIATLHPTGPLFRNVDGPGRRVQVPAAFGQAVGGAESELPRLPRFNYRHHKPEERVAAKAAHVAMIAETPHERFVGVPAPDPLVCVWQEGEPGRRRQGRTAGRPVTLPRGKPCAKMSGLPRPPR